MTEMDIKVLSLFTGCGGLDLGFEQAGFETVTCVDNDPESCKTLRGNRPEWDVFEGDIRKFNPAVHYDVVTGGPPCQGFSTAGKGNPDDPRNFLWQEYFRVVETVRPLALVLENVSGMANKKNAHHLNAFIDRLSALGYQVAYKILNAADYGVPQARKRLFLLAGLGWLPEFPEPTHLGQHVTASDAIGDLVLAKNAKKVKNHEPNDHAPHVVERWARLDEGEVDPNYRRGRIHSDRPSPTIRAGGGFGPNGNHLAGFHPPIHFKLPRQLTVRESARIQSFPDEWVFHGSKTAQGRQVGNAVPPKLAVAVASKLREGLIRHLRGSEAVTAPARRTLAVANLKSIGQLDQALSSSTA